MGRRAPHGRLVRLCRSITSPLYDVSSTSQTTRAKLTRHRFQPRNILTEAYGAETSSSSAPSSSGYSGNTPVMPRFARPPAPSVQQSSDRSFDEEKSLQLQQDPKESLTGAGVHPYMVSASDVEYRVTMPRSMARNSSSNIPRALKEFRSPVSPLLELAALSDRVFRLRSSSKTSLRSAICLHEG
jgi:hypothetical protein